MAKRIVDGEELWKPIEGYDGYEVSDQGRVRCKRAWGFRKDLTPRILKQSVGTNGYYRVMLGYEGQTKQVHRLVAENFVEGRADKLEVAHYNGDRLDNRASNLSWKTRSDNHKDKVRHGTNGKTVTAEMALAIREEYAMGLITQKELAMKHGITQSTVSKIVLKQRWATL